MIVLNNDCNKVTLTYKQAIRFYSDFNRKRPKFVRPLVQINHQ